MRLLFIHQNYPAQFGHIANWLTQQAGFECSFLTAQTVEQPTSIQIIPYRPVGGATRHNSFYTRTFENAVAHSEGVYRACKARNDLQPDLIVAHSGFGSSLFLRELFDCPIVNFFEYFYHPRGSDTDFRPELPPAEQVRLRTYTRNAMLMLDLENCDAGYSPTQWQKSRLPEAYQDKIEVIFDGIDTNLWRKKSSVPRQFLGHDIPPDTKIVTYVARGFELMRGFDIFVRTAKRIYQQHSSVLFVVVGSDRAYYGSDDRLTGGVPLRHWLFSKYDIDPEKFLISPPIPGEQLVDLFNISDLHIYLTVPFVLSWSLFNALACGSVVLASDTAPVAEVIEHEKNGLLADFFDVDALAEQALRVLRNPEEFQPLGQAAQATIHDTYCLDKTLPRLQDLFHRVTSGRTGRPLENLTNSNTSTIKLATGT